MEELICDDPDMMNLLIDTFNIYSVALIESEQDAMDYMSERVNIKFEPLARPR